MKSPTARSLDYLRKRGYTCQVVERFNYFSKQRIDLFGIIDIVAIKPVIQGVLGVQATTKSNIQSRYQKCLKEPKTGIWIGAGNSLQVHGWGLVGKVGKRKKYDVRVLNINIMKKMINKND